MALLTAGLTQLSTASATASEPEPAAIAETRPTAATSDAPSRVAAHKALARAFYENLWFNDRTDRYDRYVADTYVVHDIGARKAQTEPAIEQKEIADLFWQNGRMTGEITFQVAEGDLVATRWVARYTPETLFGRVFFGRSDIPIINVFRFRDGKIVEFWNHRHDIDTPQTMKFTAQGFVIGFVIAALPLGWLLWRRRRTA